MLSRKRCLSCPPPSSSLDPSTHAHTYTETAVVLPAQHNPETPCRAVLITTTTAPRLGDGVAAVDAQVRARDVRRSIAGQEHGSAHQVLRPAHLADGNERGPLALELRVVIEDLLGASFERVLV